MNNQAIIAAVESVHEIPGADKIQIAIVLGEQCVVGKDICVGYIGVLFPEGLQLSEQYCHENNLFRRSQNNKDTTKAGFFEESRRVRAQPFLKVRSTAYFATLESLAYTQPNEKHPMPGLGVQFDTINGHKICQKYYSPQTLAKMNSGGPNLATKKVRLTATPYFDKHVDSDQFAHMAGAIKAGSLIHFHAKIHGTSARMAHTIKTITYPKTIRKEFTIKLPFCKRWKFSVNVPNWRSVFLKDGRVWEYVVGTRNVVIDTPEKEGFHGTEGYRFEVLEGIKAHMPQGMTVYGEIAGYANGKPIMAVHGAEATKNKDFVKKYGKQITYKYGCKEHEYRFHVYRITMLGSDGVNRDFDQAQLMKWCEKAGVLGPVSVYPPIFYDGDVNALKMLVAELTERPELLGEDYVDPSHPGEGIILRVDNGNDVPKFYKSKSYFFRVMEGHCEAADTEDAA